MAKEKTKSRVDELTERYVKEQEAKAQKKQAQKMMGEIENARTRAHQQMDKEWAKYQDAKQKGRHKEAERALKMWNFFRKMCEMADKFTESLERIESIQDLLNILQGTCQIFQDLVNIDNNAMFKNMKTNLKKFRKKLREYEATMDSLVDMIDTVLDEKDNIFVRIGKKLGFIKPVSDADSLARREAELAAEREAYTVDHQETAAVETTTTKPADEGTSKGDGKGSSGFGDDLVI